MATPTLSGDVLLPGGKRMVWGVVTLDGSNPTDVALSAYFSAVDVGFANGTATSTPGDDYTAFSCAVSGTTLNIYAWNTNGTDPTLTASTNNDQVVGFVAIGSR